MEKRLKDLVWEAAEAAAFHTLDNLVGITDVNRLGQSRPTMWQHDMEAYASKWRAFGWHAIVVDGHDINALLDAYAEARTITGRPTMILARTFKGHGIPAIEDKDAWHGKPLKKGEEADAAVRALEAQYEPVAADAVQQLLAAIPKPAGPSTSPASRPDVPPPPYKLGDSVATREAYGSALARLGALDARIVVLDADVGNSTFSEKFEKPFPDRFYQMYIAEQVMVGAATGLAARGAIPFPSTFACFLTRAYNFIRMAAISSLNVKLAGSHAGVSIGEDGPSQMALEDIAMMRAEPNMTVLYPCEAVSAERLVELAAYHPGPAYIRTSRPKTPVIYEPTEEFHVGGSKVLRQSASDVATVVGAGVTVFEALAAYDLLRKDGIFIRVIDAYSVQPIDTDTLVAAGRQTGGRLITVEDHYEAGGLGDAVASAVSAAGLAVHRLAVREIPRSGKPEELLERFGIGAKQIVEVSQGVTASGFSRTSSLTLPRKRDDHRSRSTPTPRRWQSPVRGWCSKPRHPDQPGAPYRALHRPRTLRYRPRMLRLPGAGGNRLRSGPRRPVCRPRCGQHRRRLAGRQRRVCRRPVRHAAGRRARAHEVRGCRRDPGPAAAAGGEAVA